MFRFEDFSHGGRVCTTAERLLASEIDLNIEPELQSVPEITRETGVEEVSSSIGTVADLPDMHVWNQRISKARAVRLESARILLVDDSPDNQRLFHRILAAAGASVVIAENGGRAIECFEATPLFDAIIMDIRMPIVDGYEATRQIRARGFDGPIIALTAHANPGEEEKCRAAGCSDFQLKPIDRLSLLNAVERAIKSVASLAAVDEKKEGPVSQPTLVFLDGEPSA